MKTMARIYCFLIIFFAIGNLFALTQDEISSKLKILSSTGSNQHFNIQPNHFEKQGNGLDTLSLVFETDTHYMNEPFQVLYEATKLVPQRPCSLKYLIFRFINDASQTMLKKIEIRIWDDFNGKPGNSYQKYWEADLQVAPGSIFNAPLDVSDEAIIMDKPFWIGHKELTSGFPTSAIDTVITPSSNYWRQGEGYSWIEEELGDYVQYAVVEYINPPPEKPKSLIDPSIAYNPASMQLKWSCTDPDGDQLTFDVFLDTVNPPLKNVSPRQPENYYNTDTLSYSTNYYWQVIAWDSDGDSTHSAIFQFATMAPPNSPPGKPVLASPADNAKNLPTTMALQWSCSDLDNDPLSFNIYLGTVNPPTARIRENAGADTVHLTGLQNDTKYYWQVVASDGTDSTASDICSFSTKPARFDSLQLTIIGGSEEKSYIMISVPGLLDNDSPTILEQSLGVYDNTKWRFFQDNNVDLEYPGTGDLEPGRAFWLISKETKTITFGSGTYITQLENFSLPIVNGWNQIGHPFAQPIDWKDIKSANSGATIQGPYFYDAGYKDLRTNFDKFHGCYIYVENLDSLIIPPPKILAKEIAQKIAPFAEADWFIQILAECGEAQDNINYLGMCKTSEDGFDKLDYREPPVIGEYISLYFNQNNWQQNSARYTTDFRKQNPSGARWDFQATSLKDAEPITLTFANIESLPSGWKAELFDISNGRKITLAPDLNYEIINHKEIIRDFTVLVGSEQFIATEQIEIASVPAGFQLFQNYPNPFNSGTTIAYDLPNDARVKIEIFDIYGRLVDTLFARNIKAGHHSIMWNAGRFSSGVYLLKLTANADSDFLKLIYIK